MKNFKDYGSENLNNSVLSAYKERRNKSYLSKKIAMKKQIKLLENERSLTTLKS